MTTAVTHVTERETAATCGHLRSPEWLQVADLETSATSGHLQPFAATRVAASA